MHGFLNLFSILNCVGAQCWTNPNDSAPSRRNIKPQIMGSPKPWVHPTHGRVSIVIHDHCAPLDAGLHPPFQPVESRNCRAHDTSPSDDIIDKCIRLHSSCAVQSAKQGLQTLRVRSATIYVQNATAAARSELSESGRRFIDRHRERAAHHRTPGLTGIYGFRSIEWHTHPTWRISVAVGYTDRSLRVALYACSSAKQSILAMWVIKTAGGCENTRLAENHVTSRHYRIDNLLRWIIESNH